MSSTAKIFKQTSILIDYHINFKNRLGGGQGGIVFECTEINSKKKFAVKIILDNSENCNEIEAQLKINSSQNVIKIFDVYRNNFRTNKNKPIRKFLFVVMEKMEGGDLYEFILNETISENEARFLFKQIASGLQNIHNEGIIHGDIKPENILIQDDRAEQLLLKIADFGSSFKSDDLPKKLTYTPIYVAPEVIAKDENWNSSQNISLRALQSYQSDIWSLGVTLYVLLFGHSPFGYSNQTGAMNPELYADIMNGAYFTDSEEWNQLSYDLKNLFLRIFTVNPEKRISLTDIFSHPWVEQN